MFKPKKEDPHRVSAWRGLNKPTELIVYVCEKKSPTNAVMSVLPYGLKPTLAECKDAWSRIGEMKKELVLRAKGVATA